MKTLETLLSYDIHHRIQFLIQNIKNPMISMDIPKLSFYRKNDLDQNASEWRDLWSAFIKKQQKEKALAQIFLTRK
jgi:hypothetical protein